MPANPDRPGHAPATEARTIFVRGSADIHRAVRVRAAEEDRSINEVVIAAIKLYLSRPAEAPNRVPR